MAHKAIALTVVLQEPGEQAKLERRPLLGFNLIGENTDLLSMRGPGIRTQSPWISVSFTTQLCRGKGASHSQPL